MVTKLLRLGWRAHLRGGSLVLTHIRTGVQREVRLVSNPAPGCGD